MFNNYPIKHLLKPNLKHLTLSAFTSFFCIMMLLSTKVFAQAPVITGFSPISAKPNDAVTITGTGFNTTTTNNVLFFGATRALVTAATTTSVTATVPSGATYAPITLLNTSTSLATYSSARFIPIYAPAKSNLTATDFQAKQDFTTGDTPYSVALGDLDGDGKPDLVVANFGSNSVSLFRNTSTSGSIASGSFAAKVDFTTGVLPSSVAIGDLDGDGKQDLAVTNYNSNTVSVFRNISTSGSLGIGSFAAKVDFAVGDTPLNLAISDLDGDGKLDLAVVNIINHKISVLRNTSTTGSITAGSFAARVEFNTGLNPSSIAIGDLDGDSKPDVVVTNQADVTFSVLRNISISGSITTSSLETKVDFFANSNPRSIALGDLDGDGKADLAVANRGSSNVSIYRNTSINGSITTSSFANQVDFTTGSFPNLVAIGDFDGNGKPDVAVANENSNSVSILRNTSTSGSIAAGSFMAKVDFTTGTNPFSVAIGDLDGDGKPDLAVANAGSSSVSVLRNTDLPLPVNLNQYNAKLQTDGTVLLTWDTFSEQNNDYFEVSRSIDGQNFAVIGTIKGNGTTNQRNLYNYLDKAPKSGDNYYKLVQVDLDGTREELGIRSARVSLVNEVKVIIYPNPSTDLVNVVFESGKFTSIELIDLNGRLIQKKEVLSQATETTLEVRDLPSSSYLIKLVGNQETVTRVFIIKR